MVNLRSVYNGGDKSNHTVSLIVSDRGFTSEQCKKVIYGQVKHGKSRKNRQE